MSISCVFFFKQKPAYVLRISDWSSDVCSSDLVNTASVAAFEGQVGQAAYSASKGGVAALTLPAAREFARIGVRVLAIAPGLFATPMLLGMSQPVQDSLATSLTFPSRFGTPEEYAKLVLHMSDNAVLHGEEIGRAHVRTRVPNAN